MKLNPAQLAKYLVEADKNDGNPRVQLKCPTHAYIASLRPPKTSGCSECWFLYYLYCIAKSEPSKRLEEVDHLEETIMHQIESVVKGTYDFKPYDKPIVTIEKDAE